MRQAAEFLKVLSDQSRLEILWLLFNNDELCVCDIMAVLGVTQSKASRHLATLRHAGLVVDRRDGAWSYYRLTRPTNPLDAAILDSVRSRMAALPESATLLSRLGAWIQRKTASAADFEQGCRCSDPAADGDCAGALDGGD